MGKYWDWYEVEFDRVCKKVSRERRAEILDSLREHVADSSAELRAKQMSDDEAERVAVKNLGAPLDLVRAELDTTKWQWLPVWAAGIGLAWCAAWLLAGSMGWSMKMIHPVAWLTPIAVFLATLLGRKTKLWALGGTVAGIGVLTMAVLCFTWLDLKTSGGMGYIPRWEVESAIQEQKGQIAERKAISDRFEQTYLAYKVGKPELAKDLTFYAGKGWVSPTGFWGGPGQVEYQYLPTYELARKAWVTKKPRVWSGLIEEIARLERSQAAMLDPRSLNPSGVFRENLVPIIGMAFTIFGIFSGCHLLALILVWAPRAAARRRWRLAL